MRKHIKILLAGALAASLVMAIAGPGLAAAAREARPSAAATDRLSLTTGLVDNPAVTVNERGESTIGALKISPLSIEGLSYSVIKSAATKRFGSTSSASDTVVQERQRGVQYLTVIKNENAATDYEYRFPGSVLRKKP